ncbi:hypothetical protein, partial [Mycobacterium avium]
TGKQNSIALSGGGPAQPVTDERPTHAPMFARSHDEAEPNCVQNEALQPSRPVPRPVVSRTRAEAAAKGLGGPEALDLTAEEITAWAGVPPESVPDQR